MVEHQLPKLRVAGSNPVARSRFRSPPHPFPARAERVIAFGILAAGLAARVISAAGHVLSGDEALHFDISNAGSVAGVYRSSLPHAHPPLFSLLLHFWTRLATSELYLRLFPVLCGTLFLWAAWKWARELTDPPAGIAALAILAFSPGLVAVSAEARPYSLMLVFCACALLLLERGLSSASARAMLASAGFLALALLTHYSALWVFLASSVYGAVRLEARPLRSRAGVAWLAGQVGVLAAALVLYATHVSGLRGQSLERESVSGYLRGDYFDSATSGAGTFVFLKTAALFQFLAGSSGTGLVLLAIVLFGLVRLARVRPAASLLCAVPFAAALAAGLLRLYPYGGSRHSSYLGLFAAAAAGAALSRLVSRPTRAVALAAALAVAWCASAAERPVDGRIAPLHAAVAEVRRSAPPGSVFFVDCQTAYLLSYEIAPQRPSVPWRRDAFNEFDLGRYRVVAPRVWRFDTVSFERELAGYLRSRGTSETPTLWFFQAGWGLDPAMSIRRRFPRATVTLERRFRENSLVRAAFPADHADASVDPGPSGLY